MIPLKRALDGYSNLLNLTERLRGELGRRSPEELQAAARRLSRHCIPARHPDAHPGGSPGAHYGAEDSEQALADAERLLEAVDLAWKALSEKDHD